jgi:hypothetical protein
MEQVKQSLMTNSRFAINLQLDDNVAVYADTARAAEGAGRMPPVVDILVQYNVTTDDRDTVLAKVLGGLPLSPDDRAKTPFILVGTIASKSNKYTATGKSGESRRTPCATEKPARR